MFQPQPGPQTAFLSTKADLAIYGGAAGGGKTWALVAEAARHVKNPEYRATIFRRTSKQVLNQGGLWDEAAKMYSLGNAEPRIMDLEWRFPSGARVKFSHLQHETDKYDHQGGQYAFIGWDELTHFTESQFWYLLSRNRTMSGVKPYMRATCNPDANSWVSKLIAWWIDPVTGFAIPERSGIVRWFIRVGDRLDWYDSESDAYAAFQLIVAEHTDFNPEAVANLRPKSLTFIPAKLSDNPALLNNDPGYLTNLLSQQHVERERLLNGNWKITQTAGTMFKPEWFAGKFVRCVPQGKSVRRARFWDKAGGTSVHADLSSGSKVAIVDGRIYLEHGRWGRWSPGERNEIMAQLAEADDCPRSCLMAIEKEFGHLSKELVPIHARMWAKYAPRFIPAVGSKPERGEYLSAQAEAGNVYIVTEGWDYETALTNLYNFPPPPDRKDLHDDIADSIFGATNTLTRSPESKPSLPPRGAPGLGRFSR